MPRDFYCCFPFDLPGLPSVRRIRRKYGASGVLMYYELRIMVATAYQYGQHVELEDVIAGACDWDMTEAEAAGCLRDMADLRLIDASMLAEGLIGIADMAERAQYLAKKSEAGRKGNEKRWKKNEKKCDEDS